MTTSQDDKILSFKGPIIGLTCAATDCLIDYPTYAMRYRLQMGLPISFSLKSLYKGVSAYAIGMFPATTIQYSFVTAGQYYFPQNENLYHAMFASFGGIASSAIVTPISNVCVMQQIKLVKPFDAIKILYSQGGFSRFGRGLFLTAMRDGVYANLTFYGVKKTKAHLEQKHQMQSSQAHILASLINAAPCCILTQPIDTLLTHVLAAPTQKVNIIEKIKDASKKGIKEIYRGGLPRTISNLMSIFVMSYTAEKTEEYFHNASSFKI